MGNTDVKVTSQTGLPKSRVMRTEMIVMLQKNGYLTHKQAIEMMEFGNVEKIFSDTLQHENKAKRENRKIEKNPEIGLEEVKTWIYEFEDHLAHLRFHIMDRVSVKYEERYTDAQRQALDEHIKDTVALVIKNQQAQVAQAEAQAEQPGQAQQTETTPQEA